jgi:hypothetical protein
LKYLFILILAFNWTFSLGQKSQSTDSIRPPIYDTTSLEIKSTNSFYFLSKLFAIPRNCDNKTELDCCIFSAYISKLDNGRFQSQLSCSNGTTLIWTIYDTEEMAKQNLENSLNSRSQIKKEFKKFKQEEVDFFVFDNKVKAYRQSFTTQNGYQYFEYKFYGTINGQSIFGSLMLLNQNKSSKELSQLFQQLVRF